MWDWAQGLMGGMGRSGMTGTPDGAGPLQYGQQEPWSFQGMTGGQAGLEESGMLEGLMGGDQQGGPAEKEKDQFMNLIKLAKDGAGQKQYQNFMPQQANPYMQGLMQRGY